MGKCRLACVLLLSMGTSGCGILVQTMIGWSTEERVRTTRTHEVRIESEPDGAQVSRTDGKSEPKIVGQTPLVDRVEYRVEETVSTPRAWGLLGTGIGEVALGAILAGVGRTTQREQCDIGTRDIACERTGGTALFATGGTLLVFGAIDAIWGLIRLFQSDEIIERNVVEETYTYFLEKDGNKKYADLLVPKAPGLKLDLGTGVVAAPADPPPPIEPPADPRVVAVMDVEDANDGKQDAVGSDLVRNLSDQLRIFVAQQGIKTIDRTAQERAFRTQIQAMKAESYQSCYDDACQLELGKALAASHILRSKITKFGARCVLNGELIDLTKEVTIKAASAQGACQAEGFLEMSEAVARDLMKH